MPSTPKTILIISLVLFNCGLLVKPTCRYYEEVTSCEDVVESPDDSTDYQNCQAMVSNTEFTVAIGQYFTLNCDHGEEGGVRCQWVNGAKTC